MKAFLIRFTYDHYCQGFEEAEETVLVYAKYFVTACVKIKSRYINARDFRNLTIG